MCNKKQEFDGRCSLYTGRHPLFRKIALNVVEHKIEVCKGKLTTSLFAYVLDDSLNGVGGTDD